MKLSNLTLACLLATSGLSAASIANAGTTDGFEFHGYFRAGVLASADDDFKRAKWVGQKETLGRLGIETDNDMSLKFIKTFDVDDKSIRINVGVAGASDENNALGSSNGATHMGFGETFVQFGGITETGSFWGGKRDYGKDNYIFMTDFFYTDMSGTGLGVEGYEVGNTKWDFAYIASDRSDNNAGRYGNQTNNLMHTVHVGANFGAFELHGTVKSMTDNTVEVGDGVFDTDLAEFGYDLTAIYSLESFLGLPGNGFSKVIAQAGKGLGSGNLLGGTITTYNSYHPGSLQQGGGDGTTNITHVQEDDLSARLLVWGGYFLDNGINLFPAIQGQYNDHEDGSLDYWASAMVRPVFPIADNFSIATEVGYVYNYMEAADGNGGSWIQQKVTVAPTWTIGTGMGPAPEIRLLGTYLPQGGADQDGDFIVGMQADMWW